MSAPLLQKNQSLFAGIPDENGIHNWPAKSGTHNWPEKSGIKVTPEIMECFRKGRARFTCFIFIDIYFAFIVASGLTPHVAGNAASHATNDKLLTDLLCGLFVLDTGLAGWMAAAVQYIMCTGYVQTNMQFRQHWRRLSKCLPESIGNFVTLIAFFNLLMNTITTMVWAYWKINMDPTANKAFLMIVLAIRLGKLVPMERFRQALCDLADGDSTTLKEYAAADFEDAVMGCCFKGIRCGCMSLVAVILLVFVSFFWQGGTLEQLSAGTSLPPGVIDKRPRSSSSTSLFETTNASTSLLETANASQSDGGALFLAAPTSICKYCYSGQLSFYVCCDPTCANKMSVWDNGGTLDKSFEVGGAIGAVGALSGAGVGATLATEAGPPGWVVGGFIGAIVGTITGSAEGQYYCMADGFCDAIC